MQSEFSCVSCSASISNFYSFSSFFMSLSFYLVSTIYRASVSLVANSPDWMLSRAIWSFIFTPTSFFLSKSLTSFSLNYQLLRLKSHLSQILWRTEFLMSILLSDLTFYKHMSQAEIPHILQWCLFRLSILNTSPQSIHSSLFYFFILSISNRSGRLS